MVTLARVNVGHGHCSIAQNHWTPKLGVSQMDTTAFYCSCPLITFPWTRDVFFFKTVVAGKLEI